ncbi:hypothetical protein Pint_05482 [Pistacia integerrima]|uniref:Uncharacterized protein n=1 Tax=Pistacia integerrima TaxID=434235 RepID=A0ACC0Z407_9ROSI|nr:hypothetical protein Pint_05482 [Pistacia integerrima]
MISLYIVNISFNLLSGKLPTTWTRLMASYPGSFLGNPELCLRGSEARYCGETGGGHNTRKVLAGAIIGVVISVALLCALIYILVVRNLQKKYLIDRSLLQESQLRTENLPEDLKFEDIMRATEGWSDKFVIGRGKHGTVYLTESSNSRKLWAVKKINLSETNFCVEMTTLRLVRHRNVVRMAGYCIKDGYGFILTEKTDVYSYGIILLELLFRKLPVDCFEGGMDIVCWTTKKLQENEECICILDEEINFWDSHDQRKALRLLDLALECTQLVADMRPSMRDVVGFLMKLNDKHEISKNAP